MIVFDWFRIINIRLRFYVKKMKRCFCGEHCFFNAYYVLNLNNYIVDVEWQCLGVGTICNA